MWIIQRGRNKKASPPPPLRMERGVKRTLDHRQGKAPPPKKKPPHASPPAPLQRERVALGGDVLIGYSLKQLRACK